ncbi:helix-turn-helix transcriptional regulator [Mucilaginibacter lutimaris]|uniref:Helix-turn-helix transcriptional regulator n=1 Tax=Mucilaginibacter lutimaris TaxID=931629 RepID=A0ABW2ZFA2_9SPHI
MHITFSSQASLTKTIELIYPAEFMGTGSFDERCTTLNENWGTFSINELWFDGMCICLTTAKPKLPYNVNFNCGNFCWIMNFVLNGDINLWFDGTRKLLFKQGMHHTFFVSALNTNLVFENQASLLTICLTRKFISKLIGKELLTNRLDTNATKTFTTVATGDYRHTRLQAIVKEIIEASQTGHIKRIFLESRILEILSLQLQQAESRRAIPSGFSREDIARLEEARAYITQNLQTPCSLIELARKTGLNDFKLKKGFKSLFGNTVFGYLYDVRMGTAYNLLQNGKSVSEVAELIGYKNPHHFTAAFKKKFGFLPSQVNKLRV